MRKLSFALLLLAFVSTCLSAQTQTGSHQGLHKRVALSDYGKLPLSFEVNRGQTDGRVKFLSRGNGFSLYLTNDEATISLKNPGHGRVDASKRAGVPVRAASSDPSPASVWLSMQLLGANTTSRVVGGAELPGKVNYFIGNDPAKWRTNVPTYAQVKYESVYPGVDLIYYGNQGHLEYDFVIAPGADAKRIRLKLKGVRNMQIRDDGDLYLSTSDLHFQKPHVYQEFEGKKHAIAGRYQIAADNTLQFQLGEYDHMHSVVIDPVVIYSTYLGGTGGDSGDGIAVDSAGNAYITGSTASTDFPIVNALQSQIGGTGFEPNDVFITKINAKGTALVYSTYLGGEGDDLGFSIAVDHLGQAYVTGRTGSLSFPLMNALQPVANSQILRLTLAFVSKISAKGDALIYSTYLGGTVLDEGNSIAVDPAGNAYIAGITQSPDFPVSHALQSVVPDDGGVNGFITKIDPTGSAFVYSTYFGGSEGGAVNAITADAAGNAYVTGGTGSADFPTVNALQPKLKGGGNAFISKLNPSGSELIFSTYLGAGSDEGDAIAVDPAGNIYIAGRTDAPNFPTVHPLQSALTGSTDIFVSKIDSTGSALVYSTYLGGSDIDSPTGIALDDVGDAYITGDTESTNFPTVNALQPKFGGSFIDGFISEINSTGTALIYSTYLGGSSEEFGSAIAVDSIGNVYVTGNTNSSNFLTVHALQPHLGAPGVTNAFVTKIASDRTDSLNLSGSVFFINSSCSGGSSSCNTKVVGWSGGFGHVPNGWIPFPGTEKALWEAHLTSEGEVAFGKTVTLTGGKLDLLIQGQKLLSETVTNGTVVWPESSTTDLGCGDGVAQATINFETAQGKPARFSGCVHALPAGSVKPPKIWGIFQHVP